MNPKRASVNYGLDWSHHRNADGTTVPYEAVQCILLQEVRDELKRLNSLLHCPNFIGIPSQLRHMEKAAKRSNANAAKRRKAAK